MVFIIVEYSEQIKKLDVTAGLQQLKNEIKKQFSLADNDNNHKLLYFDDDVNAYIDLDEATPIVTGMRVRMLRLADSMFSIQINFFLAIGYIFSTFS